MNGKMFRRVWISLAVAAIFFMVGCVVENVVQPATVLDGNTFNVDVTTSCNDSYDYPPLYMLIAIMLPDQFTNLGGSWDAGAQGNGALVNVTAKYGDDMDSEWYGSSHPLPAGYKWVVYRTDDSFNPTGGGGDYIVNYDLNFVAHGARTGDDFTMSYASGWCYTTMGDDEESMGLEEDQSWDNPIRVTYSAVDEASLGSIKVRFN